MKNTSGLTPCEFNVIVDQDAIEKTTKGGVHIPEEHVDRLKHAQTMGTIVAVSPLAFNADVWPDETPRPEPGQRVAFAKHAGTFVDGTDGREYRVIKDKDVVALIEDKT